MNPSKKERLTGWGQTPAVECASFRPEKMRELRSLLATHPAPLLARGLGRSYGDASLEPQGTIRTERLDHLLSFDEATGIVRAQAGLSLAELMRLTIPKGWLPPVIPGTRHVTLGGMLACNVHGKNHFKHGDFAEHVLSARIFLANGESVDCSPESYPDLFWATAAGYGMTGIIEEITLKLTPITSSSLNTLTYRVGDLDDMIGAFTQHRTNADYMVGWIDHMAKGNALGRGVFEAASHLPESKGGVPCKGFAPGRTRASVPFALPPFALNRYTMALYNQWRFKRYDDEPKSELTDFDHFFHPLDAVAHWNRLYGRRGFFQYQCLLPETPDVAKHLRVLLAALHEHKLFSFLAVLKYHREGKGLLTFSKQGYSLALDFPNTARVRKFLPLLDRYVAEHGGRVYLAKDALLKPEMFYRMYGDTAPAWRDTLQRIDPGARFDSLMSQRLLWKKAQ